MSRMIALIAFALLASTVSAQTSNLWFYAGSTNCTAPGAVVVNSTVPTTNACSLVNNTAVTVYVKAACNSTNGVVTVTLYNQDSLCNDTSANGTVSSAQCNALGTSNSLSVQPCAIVSPTTSAPTNAGNTTAAPGNTTAAPTNATTSPPTNPTVKPNSASQQARLSVIAAVAVMVIAML